MSSSSFVATLAGAARRTLSSGQAQLRRYSVASVRLRHELSRLMNTWHCRRYLYATTAGAASFHEDDAAEEIDVMSGIQVTELDSNEASSASSELVPRPPPPPRNTKANEDVYRLTEALNALMKERRHQEAVRLFRGFRTVHKYQLDLRAYTTAIALHNDVADYATSLELWRELESITDIKPDLKAYTAAMEAACAIYDDVLATKILYDCMSSGITPDPLMFSMVLNLHVELRQLDRAKQIWNALRQASVPLIPSIYSSIIKLYFHERRVEALTEIIAEMERDGVTPDQTVFVCLIDYLLNIYKLAEAKQALSMLMKSGLPPTTSVFRVVIRVYQAEGILFRPGIQLTADVFNAMLSLYADEKDFEKIDQVLKVMAFRGVSRDVDTYEVLINLWASVGDSRKATEVVKEMLSVGIIPDQNMYASLINLYSQCKDLESIEEVVSTMEARQLRHNERSYNALLTAYVELGESEKAFALVTRDVARQTVRLSPLGQIMFVRVLGKLKQPEYLRNTIDHMLRDGFPFSSDMLAEVIAAFNDCDSYADASTYWTLLTSPPHSIEPNIQSYVRRFETIINGDEADSVLIVTNLMDRMERAVKASKLQITREFTRLLVSFLVDKHLISRVQQVVAASKYSIRTGDFLSPVDAQNFFEDFAYWKRTWQRAKKWASKSS